MNTERYEAWFKGSGIESERYKGEVSSSEFEKFISQPGPVDTCNANFLKGYVVIVGDLLYSILLRKCGWLTIIDPKCANSIAFCKMITETGRRVQSTRS